MIAYGTQAHARTRQRPTDMPDGGRTHKAEWMETGTDRTLAPTAYLVEQPANYAVAAHFHRQNEFQVVVHGGGSLGRYPVQPITVHYAGAYTGYGPVVAGEHGLHYFTLRPAFDPGPVYVGEHRDAMIRGPKRQEHGTPFAPLAQDALRAQRGVEVRDIFAPDAEHRAAQLLRLPPRATITGMAPTGSAGQFWMVLGGTLRHDAIELRCFETLFLSADEPPFTALAGDGGLEVLMLQVPRLAPEYATA